MQIGLVINGEKIKADNQYKVLNKYDGEAIAEVSIATPSLVHEAVTVAENAFNNNPLTPYQRYEILLIASNILIDKKEEFAKVIAMEVGKTIKEARVEVERAAQTLIASAEEAKRINGEKIPVSAIPGNEKKVAYYQREPLGVICAITPFNIPLNLSCHKIGPAIAAGNTVVWKPASTTPINASMLIDVLTEAGLPKGHVNLLYGSGSELGDLLLSDQRISKYTFTGSPAVGEDIKAKSGLRNVSLELGNNSPNIVHHDADVKDAAQQCAKLGFSNAGQVCISVQRVYVHKDIKDEFKKEIVEYTKNIKVGNPLDEAVGMGPMISEREASRVSDWIEEAKGNGANVLVGGQRKGPLVSPTIIENVNDNDKLSCEEIFGPVIVINYYDDIDEVVQLANDSKYGLQAALFTKDIKLAFNVSNQLKFGGVIINDASAYRADVMPYGGIKHSGIGREGPKYAIEEMTYMKAIVIDLS